MKPKRLISLLVAVCMMITMLPLSAVTAFAEDTSAPTGTASYGDYEYDYTINTEDGTATITKFRALVDGSYDITIPTDFGRFPVTAIGDDAFRGCSALKKVTIPPSVTSIGDSAFAGCHNLDSVTINDAATSIGNRAFTECPLTTTLSLGKKITTIGDEAFYDCRGLTSVTIPQSVTSIGNDAFGQCHDLQSLTIKDAATSIGHRAFLGCTSLETISLGENIKTIGYHAFNSCTSINLTNVTIPENVTTIRPGTFDYCTHLEYIMLPAGLTSFQDSLKGCPAGNPNGAIYYKNYKAAADALLADNDDNSNIDANDKLRKRNFLYLCKVTFDAKGGELNDDAEVPVYKTEKITDTKANDLTAIHDPTRAGYKFTGWYTADDQPFKVNDTEIMEDITLYAGWKFDPNAPVCRPLTVTGGTVTVKYDGIDVTSKLNSNTDETTGQKTYYVPDGAEVTVTLDKTLIPEGMVFDIWSTGKFSLPLGQDYKAESITFTMNTMNTMSSDVDIAAQYRDATIEDDGPNVLGTAAIIGTAAVGTAVLGYQAYSLGAEFAGKLMALPYFPSNRSALAMMLWEDAGKPMPESELLYPDVGQEERDMDLQHAARWAMENELIPDLNDEGTAPEEMKFFPANPVSKLDVLNAWQKAQELKNN